MFFLGRSSKAMETIKTKQRGPHQTYLLHGTGHRKQDQNTTYRLGKYIQTG